MSVELNYLTILTILLFNTGLIGIILNRKNILMILIAIEILILAVNLNFACLSIYLDDIIGQIIVLFIFTIAASESATGLSLITSFYKVKSNIEIVSIKKKNLKL
jgi:NADH-quinone oxidoreductase subunit K